MSDDAGNDLHSEISPHHAAVEVTKIFWRLRRILAILLVLFLILAILMYYFGGAIDTATRTPSTPGETLYFCAVTALTIGYGDIVATTTVGRIIAVLLGFIGILMTGVATGSTVSGIQVAARRPGHRRDRHDRHEERSHRV
ncbi:potassium channel family protein [Burkholderia sp. Ac-20353]|uniref:potassium channel family protein n=1 Tax=Burkholderia sp. Ac-20353 TaxID=2703894 RepID=UPI00197B25A2|nr:potassium channel family protein [Burkholderia sp. Ac-20353]MBN3789474.1 two pore domain potassium channel family protein [Burkholderia sp. Ac-20353]